MSGKWAVYERTRRAHTRYLDPKIRKMRSTWRRVGRYDHEKQARDGFDCRCRKAFWGMQLRLIDPEGNEVARHTQETLR